MVTQQHVFAVLFLAATSAYITASAQQAPTNAVVQQQRQTTPLGTRPQEFLLSKIAVSDIVKSYEFYTQVIGLKQAKGPNGEAANPPTAADPEKDFVEFPLNFTGSLADPFFVLTKRRGIVPTQEFTKLIVIGFKVPNVHEALLRAAHAGYNLVGREPADGPMAFGNISDPDGYSIEFIQAPSYPAR